MEYAYLLSIAAVVAGGVFGALARSWSILARLYSLEDRCNLLEGTLSREVKVRAANGRWGKRDQEDAILAAALDKPAPHAVLPWWTAAAQKHPRYFPGSK
jgi:hypothetical protein